MGLDLQKIKKNQFLVVILKIKSNSDSIPNNSLRNQWLIVN
jgi:hypothetical protein